MSRNRRFRPSRALAGTAGAVALTGLLALSGCGTGQLSQTATQTSAVNGVSADHGPVAIRDARIAFPPQPADGVLYRPGGSAPLEVTLINTGSTADRLVRVSSPVSGNVTIGGDAAMPKDVTLASQVAAEGGAPQGTRPITIALAGLTTPIKSGLTVPVTFTFERTGSVTLQVPIGAPAEGTEPERHDSEAAAGEGGPGEAPAAPGEGGH